MGIQLEWEKGGEGEREERWTRKNVSNAQADQELK